MGLGLSSGWRWRWSGCGIIECFFKTKNDAKLWLGVQNGLSERKYLSTWRALDQNLKLKGFGRNWNMSLNSSNWNYKNKIVKIETTGIKVIKLTTKTKNKLLQFSFGNGYFPHYWDIYILLCGHLYVITLWTLCIFYNSSLFSSLFAMACADIWMRE